MNFSVKSVSDIYALKAKSKLDHVAIDLTQIKYQGLAHHAMRLAFFAVREGGEIKLTDKTATKDQSIGPFLIGWPTLRALALRSLGKECDLLSGSEVGEMRFVRTAPALAQGWSAGLIFSGNDQELPAVYRCLDGLIAQPELCGENGEIIVCGPTRDLGFLESYPQVTYLVFDLETSAGPFPISRKKNFLLRHMAYPRRLVLHARMVLDPGVLADVPDDFDILGPNVIHRSDKGEEANIGLIYIDPGWPTLVPRGFERSTLSESVETYLRPMANRRPFVDGGAFAVTERVFNICPLDDNLLWGDCEDVEWCFRAQSLGLLVDMEPKMIVVNTVSKARTLETLPRPIARGLRQANRLRRSMRNLSKRLRMTS